jgi:hypothetical protein
MADSLPRRRKAPAQGTGRLPASGQGSWELDLLTGTAAFSEWIYLRLQWPAELKRTRLIDLRPNLPAGAWEALLLAIRAHLERQMPLDVSLRVHLPDGKIQCWRVLGSSLRNGREKPVLLTGTVHEIIAE